MKKKYVFYTFFFIFLISLNFGQTWSSKWSVDYVTADSPDSLNSIGANVISVTTLSEDSFVALVNRGSYGAYYLVAFKDAGSNKGRMGDYGYGGDELDNFRSKWINFFDQEILYDANDLASKGNLVYVANNDSLGVTNSILVFEVKEDSIYSYPQRYKVNDYIWGIDVDGNGRIYVTKTGDSLTAGSVMVLESPDVSPKWASNGNSGTILQEFSLPEIGSARGITVNEDGTVIYVGNWDENKVYCYIGDPINGYSLYDGFNFSVDNTFEAIDGTLTVGPFGLQLMPTKNLLFVCHDADFVSGGTNGYMYGRIYVANPNTGEVIDTINAAEWNYYIEGQYDNHVKSNASGYTSNFAVDFDENFNVYTQSWYGWTVDKWIYDGELPTVEITVTDIEKINNSIPNDISLGQNYPNPFNPSTTIEFNINSQSDVELSIYNVTGELISNLVKSSNMSAGAYKITFDASNLSSGNYFYKLRVGNNVITKKMSLIK
ncbi:MAG: T9SS type A sorting domain-containing protein [Ignavibacteriales bacterium]|nr:T9SS type A sorting domain-containing protein [Ignavibacteriales bacterium]